jgi:hypothetical protein
MGIESTIFWLVLQYNEPQIITTVPHTNVKQILIDTYRFKAIHKNTKTLHTSTRVGFPVDRYQLKHTDIYEKPLKINMANFIMFFYVQ